MKGAPSTPGQQLRRHPVPVTLLQLSTLVHTQVRLMAEVNAMLSSFAEQKAAAVATAVACMHDELAQGRSRTETSFNALSQAASSANEAIRASTASHLLYMLELPCVVLWCITPETQRELARWPALLNGVYTTASVTPPLSVAQAEEASAAEGHTAAAAHRNQLEQDLQAALAESTSAGLRTSALHNCTYTRCRYAPDVGRPALQHAMQRLCMHTDRMNT